MKRLAREHHLEPVELGRIVGPGDLNAPVGPQRGDGEVQRRSGQRPHVDGGASRLHDAAPDALRQLATRRPVVAPHRDGGRVTDALPGRRREGAAQGTREVGGQLAADQAAHVVLPEDRLGDVHVACSPRPTAECRPKASPSG